MGTKVYQTTPPEVLPLIADLLDRQHTPLLDPCAGDGETINYLANKWSCSRYAVEPVPELYNRCKEHAKALNERFEDVYARHFCVIYAYPPFDMKNPVSWLRGVAEAATDDGIVIWRLTKKQLLKPKVIEVFTELYYKYELFKDPPHVWDRGNHYTIRCRKREEPKPVDSEWIEFAQAVERAPVLGSIIVEPWSRDCHGRMTFRQRGLEWEDVYPELVETLRDYKVPKTGEKFDWGVVSNWDRAIQCKEDPMDSMKDPIHVNASYGQCWSAGHVAYEKKVYIIALVGRKTAIAAVESEFKRGNGFRISYKNFKPIGGITGARNDYRVTKMTLPETGAHVHIWVHKKCTSDSAQGMLWIPENKEEAARLISNACGIPITPEWMDDIPTSSAHSWYATKFLMNGYFKTVNRELIMKQLGKLAKGGNLTKPEPIEPEKIRPIMPPSVGIYAQLAMQEFINNIPLPGGIIMFAKPIEIDDIDTEEALDGVIEKTTILRKDAIRVVVFHYEGDDAGLWEVFETERIDDATQKSGANATGNNP